MTANAFAKINLGLNVLRKRDDGYHDLRTVMLAIEWHDTVSVEPAESLQFTSTDPALASDDNLCMRAARLLAEASGTAPGASIHLEKHLPYGAGLGGGSSDAAATLLLLNELWGTGFDVRALEDLAARLGSDVPFFVRGVPALAESRGEMLTPLDDYACPFDLVVVMPHERVSTAEAYGLVRPSDVERPDLAAAVWSNDLERWRRELVNDFEGPIIARHPAIGAIRDALMDAGAGYAAMSGSGSALFGVFDDASRGHAAAETFREQGFLTWHGRAVT